MEDAAAIMRQKQAAGKSNSKIPRLVVGEEHGLTIVPADAKKATAAGGK